MARKKSCREWFKPVLVMETGENWFRDNPMSLRNVVADRSCHGHSGRLGNPRTEARVRASPIVMRDPLGQDRPQLPFMERNDVVETFSTRRPDQALAERVRLRHADRCFKGGQSTTPATVSIQLGTDRGRLM